MTTFVLSLIAESLILPRAYLLFASLPLTVSSIKTPSGDYTYTGGQFFKTTHTPDGGSALTVRLMMSCTLHATFKNLAEFRSQQCIAGGVFKIPEMNHFLAISPCTAVDPTEVRRRTGLP